MELSDGCRNHTRLNKNNNKLKKQAPENPFKLRYIGSKRRFIYK